MTVDKENFALIFFLTCKRTRNYRYIWGNFNQFINFNLQHNKLHKKKLFFIIYERDENLPFSQPNKRYTHLYQTRSFQVSFFFIDQNAWNLF